MYPFLMTAKFNKLQLRPMHSDFDSPSAFDNKASL